MTHSHVYRDMAHLLHTCDVTWLLHMCDMTHSYLWHDAPASGWSAAPWALYHRANSRTCSACAAVPFWLSSRNPWRFSPRFCRAVTHTPTHTHTHTHTHPPTHTHTQKWVQIAEHVQRVQLFLFLDSSRNLWRLLPRVCHAVTHTHTHTHTHVVLSFRKDSWPHRSESYSLFSEISLIPLTNQSHSVQRWVEFPSEMGYIPFRNDLYTFHSRYWSGGDEEQGNKTHF